MDNTSFTINSEDYRKCSITDDFEIAYLEKGSGQPVVLIHGSMTDFSTWHLQIEPFSQHYRTIAYSRRNHYPNSWIKYPADYSCKGEVDDLVKFIQTLGLSTPLHLIGSSYGANIAIFAAQSHSKLVSSLVLCEPALFPLLASDSVFVANFNDYRNKIAKKSHMGDKMGVVTVFFNYVMGTHFTLDQIPFGYRNRLLLNVLTLPTEDCTCPFTCDDARKIDIPTLLVNGEKSPSQFIRIIEEISGCLPNSERATIKGVSHGMYYQNAKDFNEVVLRFLAKHNKF